LLSNPCNPTGQLIEGQRLKKWIELTCKFNCSFIFDEFYSHYIYSKQIGKMISSARYVEDVNNDPIIIVDGLTKNWRYPGWRIGWIVGPKEVVEAASSASSFVNGGANHPLQKEALGLLKPKIALAETKAIQKNFSIKRDFMLKFLKNIGIKVEVAPQGTFYVWANLNSLPKSLQNGEDFFAKCLAQKTIVVPGIFFDVNPNKRRIYSNYQNYVRLSFGPPLEELKRGLEAIKRVVKS
jgi:aspartate/methionine/tyrosine aminotransferase